MDFIIDNLKLEKLLKDFYTLTKIRIVVFDTDFNEIISFPNHHSTYCKLLREDEKALKKCELCDKEACNKSKLRKNTVIYRCYAGLVEAVTPIKYEDTVMGYIMFGQILQTDNYDNSWKEILPVISKFDVDISQLKKAFYKKQNLTSETISSASSIMQACSGYLYLSKMISLKSDSLENRIDDYIRNNFDKNLTTENLCEKFLISRTRLYEISKTNYNKPIAEYIRDFRINKAKFLLVNTNKKISEIATLCGIPDYVYFTKIFKRLNNNITPKDWRKNFNK